MAGKKKIDSEYSFIGLQVTGYEISVGSSINYEVKDKRMARLDTPVFGFDTRLEIEGRCLYPEEEKDTTYSITAYASTRDEGRHSLKLDDCHAIDEQWQRIYRKTKDQQVPIYNIPKGIGHIERRRGTGKWSGWLQLPQKMVTDMLILLPQTRPLYLSINRFKEGRIYFITHFSLQTNDPAES